MAWGCVSQHTARRVCNERQLLLFSRVSQLCSQLAGKPHCRCGSSEPVTVLKLCWVSAAVAAVAQPQQQAAAASSFGKACLEIVLDPVGCSCSHCGPGWAGLHVQVMMSAAAVPVYCMAYAH
jgi:hypothetical protein